MVGSKDLNSPLSNRNNQPLIDNENKFVRRSIVGRATFNANVVNSKTDSPLNNHNKLINSLSL